MTVITATSFRQASASEWEAVSTRGNRHYVAHAGQAALALLASQRDAPSPEGWLVNNYQHSLQCASRALRAGESEEFVVCALLHDIGQDLDPLGHDKIAGTLLAPFVSAEHAWMVSHHQVFQLHFRTHSQFDRHALERYRDHPYFERTYYFCENYDQNCFDPAYDSLPLETFEPLVRRLFAAGTRARLAGSQ
jgi:predicted HD phosphohydrolase